MHAAVHDDPPAATGAQDHPEHRAQPCPGTVGRLAQREAVGVVIDAHLPAQRLTDVAVEGVAVERDRVGILHLPRGRADDARNADPDGCAYADPRLRLRHQADDRVQGRRVAGGRRNAPAMPFLTIGIERRDLDFCAPEVDADPPLSPCRKHGAPCPTGEARHDAGMSERVLDVKQMKCPLPVLRANRELRGMAPGERLRVLATDRAAIADFQAYCRETRHALLAWSEEAGVFSFVIRRRAEDPAPAEDSS